MASRFTFRDRAGLLFSLSIDIVNVCLIVFIGLAYKSYYYTKVQSPCEALSSTHTVSRVNTRIKLVAGPAGSSSRACPQSERRGTSLRTALSSRASGRAPQPTGKLSLTRATPAGLWAASSL